VVGVMAESFVATPAVDAWVPLGPVAKAVGGGSNLTVIARLRSGTTLEAARAEMRSLGDALRAARPDLVGPQEIFGAEPYGDFVVGSVRSSLLLLFGAVAFVLLIAASNVANLLLARASSRSREIAIRASLGATRGRIVQQLVVESVLLAILG